MPEKYRARSSRVNGIAASAQPQEVMSNDLSEYVTTKRAAEMLGLVTTSVNHLLAAGRIKGKKLGPIWLVYIPSLEEYMKTKAPTGRPTSTDPELERKQ